MDNAEGYAIAELFQKGVNTINEHIKNIYSEWELDEQSTIRRNRIVQIEGKGMNMINLISIVYNNQYLMILRSLLRIKDWIIENGYP